MIANDTYKPIGNIRHRSIIVISTGSNKTFRKSYFYFLSLESLKFKNFLPLK